MEENEITQPQTVQYTEENVIHLSDMEHVRTRPGMYIGRLGDGSHAEDGIYVLLKEVIDNSIDESLSATNNQSGQIINNETSNQQGQSYINGLQ